MESSVLLFYEHLLQKVSTEISQKTFEYLGDIDRFLNAPGIIYVIINVSFLMVYVFFKICQYLLFGVPLTLKFTLRLILYKKSLETF
jgi:hypothetical protein